jgi:anhydro-N-acetylmuramic acid kinase
VPYPEQVRVALRRCQREGRLEALARLNVIVGELFAEAALALLRDAQVAAGDVVCIGSHGQTLLHLPEPSAEFGPPVQATLQIGESAVIAARTGIVTVADFRPADLALGGQGAPLVPFLDWHLFRSTTRDRVLLNIGGVSNLTWLPADCGIDRVVAFDTGPGNVLIDRVARQRGLTGGIDDGGAGAAAGTIDGPLFAALLADPYYDAPPPKSADAAQFEMFLGTHQELSTEDLLATVTEVTAQTIAVSVDALSGAPKEILLAGGGAHNDALRARIAALLPDDELRDLDEVSPVSADAKEAVAFALLGLETLARRPGNVPSATGAQGPAILGKIAYPPPLPA